MATQVTIVTTDGRIIHGINYRMDPSVAPAPSTPLDPTGGTYHIQTPNGWLDIPNTLVKSITLDSGAPT